MPDLVRVRTALLSVSNKAGLIDFARGLSALGVRLISTGGTAKALHDAALPVTPIEDLTNFPEMMDGRLKTLHPKVHGGLLALRDLHADSMRQHAIEPIDLVCINLYPFEQTIARPGVTRHDAIENIDIGGPAMIRSASKNFAWVAPVTSPDQYDRVLAELNANAGSTTLALRSALAREAFESTAAYDAVIADYFRTAVAPPPPLAPSPAQAKPDSDPLSTRFPERLTLSLRRAAVLSYGENQHQQGAAYTTAGIASTHPSVLRATKHHGKDLSYNNLNDAAAALALAMALADTRQGLHTSSPQSAQGLRASSPQPAHPPSTSHESAKDRKPTAPANPHTIAAAVVKHTNPCGAAVAGSIADAVQGAMIGDPLAAYGGILAVSHTLDEAAADWLCARDVFLEVILAPEFTPQALERLSSRWKNVRLLSVRHAAAGDTDAALLIRPIPGGAIVQTADTLSDPATWNHAAGPAPSPDTRRAAASLEAIARALSSNAIAIGGPDPERPGVVRLFGAGAGQMDRVAACRLAVEKAGPLARASIAFSDAFFPFSDGPQLLIDAGVTTIVHPGGSRRDADTFALCNKHAVTCLTTGVRHFRH